MDAIVSDISLAAQVVKDPAYLVVWCTYPTLWDFTESWWSPDHGAVSHRDWKQLTGGTWGKIGRRGIGFHMRGDSEPVLVFRKGKPPRGEQCSNLWQSEYAPRAMIENWLNKDDVPPAEQVRVSRSRGDVFETAFWPERKTPHHSEKPSGALADLLRVTTKPGDLVLDMYAGASASLARVCHLLGRDYVGAEADPERCERATRTLEAIC